ncbi:MAG: Ig-like domain-containing protein, partial [Zoogloeaceae bacterium]|nr:Ig-like domain-containing protein [Zoogloeaceae bacterium]
PYEVDTEASATITIDVIAGDDVINAEESEDDVTITGTVGGDAKEGDTVTLTIGGNEYTGLVAGDLTYSIDVPGSVLVQYDNIQANVTGTDPSGNPYSADNDRDYGIDLDGPSVTVTFGDESLPMGGSTSITIDFSEEAYDPDTGEPLTAEQLEALLVVTGGTVSGLVQDGTDPTIWTGTFTAGEDFAGQASAEVPAASYADQAGNPGTAGSDDLGVFDPPSIAGLDGTGAEVTVNEAYLPSGTQAGMGVAEGSGSFTITATAGLAVLSFSGTGFAAQDFTLAQLNAIAGDGPLSFETSKGTLTLTGFTVSGDTYTVEYTYTLTEAGDHPEQGVDEVAKDAIVVSAQDALGQDSADSSLDVSIIDDIPVDVSQDAIVQNSADSVLVGNLVQFGADGAQSVEFTGVNGGADLYSNGVKLVYVIDGDTVTATAGEGGPVVFTIQASTDGTYTFEQFARVDLFQLLPTDTTAGGSAGGPKEAYYIAEGSGGFSGNGGIPWLAKITGLGGAEINANNNQMGVANPSITNGEGVRIDFDQSGLSGSANLVAAAEVGFRNFTTGSFTYVVTYVGGATASGTITPADLVGGLYLFPMSESGAAVDYIELTAVGTASNTGITALNTYIMDDSMVADLEFEFNAVDGDGDTVPGSVSVTIQNDPVLSGTGGDDALAGGGDDNEISGGAGNDALFGGDGDDILDGGDGDDLLFGGGGDDTLQGGVGNDLLVGGQGDDILTGGDGDDTFQWLSGDVGSAGAPATDVVTDFGNGQNVLDLSDLLSDATSDTLSQYLSIESDGGDTVLKISSSGGFSGDALADAALVDQVIVLQGFSVGGDNLSEMLTSLGDQIKVDNSNN